MDSPQIRTANLLVNEPLEGPKMQPAGRDGFKIMRIREEVEYILLLARKEKLGTKLEKLH